MPAVLLTQVYTAFRTFDDAVNTYDTLAGIADGLKKGNDRVWSEGTDISKYLWNPTTPLQQKVTAENRRLVDLAATLDRISRDGLDPQVYKNVASLTDFNKKTFNLASKANYYAQLIGKAEQELRRFLASSKALTLAAAFFGTTALHATVFQLAEAYKALKGQLATIESKANSALKKVSQNASGKH